ncbi:MAG TPA: hypothetical protein VFA63_14860 [Pseudonocardiaceae bacterium]|nr:hypothetical protein [Pseudonocardiaceae bacterium]
MGDRGDTARAVPGDSDRARPWLLAAATDQRREPPPWHPAHAACMETVTIGQPDGDLVGTRIVLRGRAVPPRGKQR